jgi:putative regulator of septum formation
MRGLVLRIGIIGAVAVGAFVLRPFITGNAGSLQLGDCFDVPATQEETVDDVQHHPCTADHGAEVVFVGDYAPATDTPPTSVDMQAFVGTTCIPAFNTYTGLDFGQATDYDLGWFWPTAEGWQKGDHKVICYVMRVDAASFSQSLRKK